VFDDGYEEVFSDVLPLLKKYNLRGVFAVPTGINELDSRALAPWQNWMQITADGHELASHGVNHKDLTELKEGELERELREPAEVLRATTIVYPGGAHNKHVVGVAQKHYKAGRTVLRGFENLSPKQVMRLKTFNYTKRNFRRAVVSARVIWAWLANKWLIETYHLVGHGNKEAIYNIDKDAFEWHLKMVSKIPISNKTIKEVVQ